MSEADGTPDIRLVATCDHCGQPMPESGDSAQSQTVSFSTQGMSSDICPKCGQQKEENIQEWLDREMPRRHEIVSVYFQCADYLVVKVKDDSLKRNLMLKVFKKSTVDEPEGSTELAEAELLASINHPHMLTVYDTGFTREGRLYILMEDPGERTLEYVIQKEGFLDLEVALNLFQQYSEALHSLHELSIVHGAIRPRSFSVIELEEGVILGKLTNCGITRCSEDDLKLPTKIGRNYTCLDAFYMSPEECNSLPQDLNGEIYSLGCVFFHSITGKPVFRARDLKEAVKQHTDGSAARFRRQYEIKEDVQKVILKMLEKEPEKRYPSVKEVEHAIAELLGERKTSGNSIWQKIVARVRREQNKNRF